MCRPGNSWHRGAFWLPVLDGVLASLVVEAVSVRTVADHALVVEFVRPASPQ